MSNSQDTAEDVYAFLQLFLEKFPKFQKGEFHLAGESYFGTYAPNIASVIHKHNLNKPTQSALHIPLASVLIGNGLTDACAFFSLLGPPRGTGALVLTRRRFHRHSVRVDARVVVLQGRRARQPVRPHF